MNTPQIGDTIWFETIPWKILNILTSRTHLYYLIVREDDYEDKEEIWLIDPFDTIFYPDIPEVRTLVKKLIKLHNEKLKTEDELGHYWLEVTDLLEYPNEHTE